MIARPGRARFSASNKKWADPGMDLRVFFMDFSMGNQKCSWHIFLLFFLLTPGNSDNERISGRDRRNIPAGSRMQKNIFEKPLTFSRGRIF